MKVCMRCHYEGRPKMETPGSFGVEVILWLLMVLPGLIYSLWRHSSRREVCAFCGSNELLRADSPKARELAASIGGPAQREMQDQIRGKRASLRANNLKAFGVFCIVAALMFLGGESYVYAVFAGGAGVVLLLFGIDQTRTAKARYG